MAKEDWKPSFSTFLKYLTLLFLPPVPLLHFRLSSLLITYILPGHPAFSFIPLQSIIHLAIKMNTQEYEYYNVMCLTFLILCTLPWLKTFQYFPIKKDEIPSL